MGGPLFGVTLPALAAACLLHMPATPPPAETNEVWLDIPFVAQVENGCGPASISMVMKYWAAARRRPPDPAAEEETIRQSLIAGNSRGAFAGDVARYFEGHGFHSYTFDGAWTDLEHHLARGRPLIVALAERSDTFHLLVVAGIDSSRGILLVNDPARRKLQKLKRAEFEKAWSRCGNWTLLALPNDES